MSFWAVHGYFVGTFLILFLITFPRFTMVAFMVIPAGVIAWIGEPFGLTGFLAFGMALIGWVAWLLAPRFLIAILATVLYGMNNPVLCIGAWFFAFAMLQARKKAAEKMARERQEKREESERLAAEEKLKSNKQYSGAKAKADQRKRTRPDQSAGQRVQQWWEVLGVSPSASTEAIKSAYRAVAKATHPDSAPDHKGDVEKFRKANEAYQKGLRHNGT